ncbi:hypothetical protein MTO96_018951 [Rhipicephalus appendiculatus]
MELTIPEIEAVVEAKILSITETRVTALVESQLTAIAEPKRTAVVESRLEALVQAKLEPITTQIGDTFTTVSRRMEHSYSPNQRAQVATDQLHGSCQEQLHYSRRT